MSTNLLNNIGFILKETFSHPFKDSTFPSKLPVPRKIPKYADFASWSVSFNTDSDTNQSEQLEALGNVVNAHESTIEILLERLEALEEYNSKSTLKSGFKIAVWILSGVITVTCFALVVYFSGESNLTNIEKMISKVCEYLFTISSGAFVALIVEKASSK